MLRKIGVATLVAAAVLVVPAPSAAAALPPGMTASYLMVDRQSGRTVAKDEHKQFRSASLVKVLIALDYLERLGPDAEIPPADAELMRPMLRSSANDPASELWVRGGYEQVIYRMSAQLGLVDTDPPADRGMWGYTATTAADVVRMYRYILEKADPDHREFIMGHLRAITQCSGTWDQSWGIPSAVGRPYAAKQGWSAWGSTPPAGDCAAGPRLSTSDEVDLTSPLMHTSGTLGWQDSKILVVMTLQPQGTTYTESARRITDLTTTVTRS